MSAFATRYNTATIEGLEVFYREAGDPNNPTLLLLHGFPSSSHMFRNLINSLADEYHLVAPDHIGFGRSAMPTTTQFTYSFDRLTEITEGLIEHLGLDRFALYIHDYGAPIGLRIASRRPGRITALITQSGNAYLEGFTPFWDILFAHAKDRAANEDGVREKFTPETTYWQYTHGVPADRLDRIAPETWQLDQLGLDRYAFYVQDYGAPIGWRLALHHPERISALVTQNGNGYEDGFVESFWTGVWAYGADPGPATEPAVRAALGIDAIRWQYVHGVPDPSLVSPDTWEHDFALVSREGNDEVQLALFRDYQNNRPLYPLLHEFLRTSEVPVLAVWGRNDEIFGPAGARAFARDAKDAEVHLINGGHFLLESHLDIVAGYLRGFLGRVLG